MADLKISQFSDGGLVENTDEIAAVRGGVNTKVTVGTSARYEVGTGSGQIATTDMLAPVALSNDYNDLGNLPTLGALSSKDQVEASDIDSGSATAGQVPTSDGSGGVTWEDQSGSGTVAASAVSALDPNNLGSTNAQGQLNELGNRSSGDYQGYSDALSGNFNAIVTGGVDGAIAGFTNAPNTGDTTLNGFVINKTINGSVIIQTYMSYHADSFGKSWSRRYDGTWSIWLPDNDLPSNRFEDITIVAGGTYSAEYDGWVQVYFTSTTNSTITLVNNGNSLGMSGYTTPPNPMNAYVPVKKGDTVALYIGGSGTISYVTRRIIKNNRTL